MATHEAAVPSPCVGVCQLDAASVCVGCGRQMGEIVEWPRASDARRREILLLSSARRAAFSVPDAAPSR